MTDLRARRGDDETYELTILQPDGTPLDLTGLTIWFTVKGSYEHSDADALVQLTVGSGITVVDAVAGRADVALPADALSSLPARSTVLVWDCQVKDAAGNVQTVAGGQLVVDPDVTQSTSVA